MKCILVTGCNGFLGIEVVSHLLNCGYLVVGLSRKKSAFNHSNFKSIQIDLTDRNKMNLIDSFDVVIHLAGSVSAAESLDDPLSFVQNNIVATANLLDLFRLRGGKGMVYVSSGKIYPIKDSVCRTPYGVTKLCADLLVQEFQSSYQLPISILRFTSFYGPYNKPPVYPDQSWINWFCYSNLIERGITLYGKGMQQRDPIYISDAANLIVKIIENKYYSIITDVGGGLKSRTSPAEVVEIIQKISKKSFLDIKQVPLRSDMKDNFFANNRGVQSIWEPIIGIEEGIRNTLKNMDTWFED
jgi:nucleoside-diphosphate-sugar epimerase